MILQDFLEYKNKNMFTIPEEMVLTVFRPVLADMTSHRHREYVFTGGRGSTKSTFASLGVISGLKQNKNAHALILRQVQDTLKDSVYAQMQWTIDKLGLSDEFIFKTSPLEIIHKVTRQRIYFRGADDPMKIKSIKPPFGFIGILWFEELDQFKGTAAVRNITQSAVRGGNGAVIIKSFNPPKSSLNWANKYVKIPKDSMLVTHNTYKDVPPEWLGDDFISEAEELKEINPQAYEHEYMGISNGTGGAVFDNVTVRRITDDEIRAFDRIYRGQDWGWYPDYNRLHDVYYNASRKTLYIFGEISCRKTSNEQYTKLLEKHGVKKQDPITADREMKTINDFRSWGWNMHPAIKGPGSVESGMKWLCSLKEIIIDNVRCPYAAEEFVNYEYDRDKNGDVISGYPDRDNHSIDAVRYALERVWRQRGK